MKNGKLKEKAIEIFDPKSKLMLLVGVSLLALDSWAFRFSKSDTLRNYAPAIYEFFNGMNQIGFVVSFAALSLIFIALTKRLSFSLLLAAVVTAALFLLHV